MTALHSTATLAGEWTFDWERGVIADLAGEAGLHLPETPGPVRAPATDEERRRFYDYWSYVGALDLFIVESCAYGLNLAPDPEFKLFLTRQIGDDGFHAQRFREQVWEVSGRDPLPDMVDHAEHQWDVFGDLSHRSWEGFLAFELHYELYVVPSLLVNGRTSTINDPLLVELSAERFTPDEAFHRSFVANWWRRRLAAADASERADLIARLRPLDDEGQRRREPELQAHWAAARAATGSNNHSLPEIYHQWREIVQSYLYPDSAAVLG